jgi:hypothetical protein
MGPSDPIDFAGGGANLYGYVMNDPVNFKDPSGLVCPIPRDVDPLAHLEDLYYYSVDKLQDAAKVAAAINAGVLGVMAAEYGYYFVATHHKKLWILYAASRVPVIRP